MTKKLYPDCFRTGDTKLLLKIEFPSLISRLLLYSSSLICSEDNPLCSKKMVLKESHYLERHLWREEKSRYLTKSWFSEKTVGWSLLSEFQFYGLLPKYQLKSFCTFKPFGSTYALALQQSIGSHCLIPKSH